MVAGENKGTKVNGLTNAEWLAGVVVTFGLQLLWDYITEVMD